jgi:hypothetical protein
VPTKSVTATATVTQPAVTQKAQTTSVTNSTSIKVQPTSTTPAAAESTGSSLPWWGWALIGLGVVAIITLVIVRWRRSKRRGPREPGGHATGAETPG